MRFDGHDAIVPANASLRTARRIVASQLPHIVDVQIWPPGAAVCTSSGSSILALTLLVEGSAEDSPVVGLGLRSSMIPTTTWRTPHFPQLILPSNLNKLEVGYSLRLGKVNVSLGETRASIFERGAPFDSVSEILSVGDVIVLTPVFSKGAAFDSSTAGPETGGGVTAGWGWSEHIVAGVGHAEIFLLHPFGGTFSTTETASSPIYWWLDKARGSEALELSSASSFLTQGRFIADSEPIVIASAIGPAPQVIPGLFSAPVGGVELLATSAESLAALARTQILPGDRLRFAGFAEVIVSSVNASAGVVNIDQTGSRGGAPTITIPAGTRPRVSWDNITLRRVSPRRVSGLHLSSQPGQTLLSDGHNASLGSTTVKLTGGVRHAALKFPGQAMLLGGEPFSLLRQRALAVDGNILEMLRPFEPSLSLPTVEEEGIYYDATTPTLHDPWSGAKRYQGSNMYWMQSQRPSVAVCLALRT